MCLNDRRKHAINFRHSRSTGFIALISILIVGSLLLVITASAAMRAVGGSKIAIAFLHASRASALANACAEHAVASLKNNLQYSGNEHIIISEGADCSVLGVTGSGNLNRTISATSTVLGHARKVRIVIDSVRPTLLVREWRFVSDF